MRRVLVLGGTAWLGRAVAGSLLERGADVTCLARGRSGHAPDGARLITSDRAEDGAYNEVAGQAWDEVVELSSSPAFVRSALSALAHEAEHWTLVSSVSVYASNAEPGADESAAVVEPEDETDYPSAKAASERAAARALGDRLLIVRPGLIAGPGDGSDRFGYWVARLALAGREPVLVPGVDSRHVQVIDVRDLATWIVEAGSSTLSGTFNAVGNEHTFAAMLTEAAAAAGFTGALVEAAEGWLIEQGVHHWAGPRSLPLWLPGNDDAMARRSNTAFRGAGGALRSLTETLTDTLDDERRRGLDRPRRSGLSRAEELELLGRLRGGA